MSNVTAIRIRPAARTIGQMYAANPASLGQQYAAAVQHERFLARKMVKFPRIAV